jgi:hypothetical protein
MLAQAEQRGDRYTAVNLRTSAAITTALAEDDPETARRHRTEALAQWPRERFFVQHWQALMAMGPDVDLYVGDPAAAYESFQRHWPALRKSFLLHSGFIRTHTWLVAARYAVASIEVCRERRRARIAEAWRMVRRLERETDPFPRTVAPMSRGIVANADGDREGAVAALRDGIERAEQAGMRLFAATARLRLAQLLVDDALLARARSEMTASGVRNPDRWASVHFPGRWRG